MKTEDKIKKYIENRNLYDKALLIDDDWGTGKSSIIKQVLSGKIDNFKIENSEFYLIINANEINEKTNIRKELFLGSKKINTDIFFEDVEEKKNKIVSYINKNRKTIKNIFNKIIAASDGFLKKKTDVDNIITNAIGGLGIGIDTFVKNINFDNYILVIDEVDRMPNKSNIKNIYSKIIELQETTKIRIIIVMNSKKVEQKFHNSWKDKIYSASINLDNYNFFYNIKPTIWDDVKEKLKEITPNYKNIRIIEKYNKIDNFINKFIKDNLEEDINKYQEEKINRKKQELIIKLFSYYNKEDYKNKQEKKYNENEYEEYISEIKNLLNLNNEILEAEMLKIIKYYDKEYSKLQDDVQYLYKEFYHKNQITLLKKKSKAIEFIIDKIIKENLNKLLLNYPEHKKFGNDNIIMYYHEILIKDFNISKKDELRFILLIKEKIKSNREKYSELSWEDRLKELEYQKINYFHMSTQKFLNEKEKYKLLKVIKKDINKIYKNIIANYDGNLPKIVKKFHFKHNCNIFHLIYSTIEEQYNLLDEYRELKDNINKNVFDNRKNIYYSNLDIKDKISKSYMNKI